MGSRNATLTFVPSLGWATCHIIRIDRSVSSASLPPTKVTKAKHSSNYKTIERIRIRPPTRPPSGILGTEEVRTKNNLPQLSSRNLI